MLNYSLEYQADLFKRRVTGEYETDEWGLDWEYLNAVRPFFEFMNSQEVGIGYGFTDRGAMKQAYYRNTFARLGNFYGAATIEAFGMSDRSGWSAMAQVSYRW
jgi:hypothetical protein